MSARKTSRLFPIVLVCAALLAAWRLLAAVTAAFIDQQMALYIGLALMIGGLQVARHMPKYRKLGLLAAVVGAVLVAYGLGYLG